MPASTSKRRFEFVEGNLDKFWEININGNEVEVRFGRTGTNGQVNTKTFPDSLLPKSTRRSSCSRRSAKGTSRSSDGLTGRRGDKHGSKREVEPGVCRGKSCFCSDCGSNGGIVACVHHHRGDPGEHAHGQWRHSAKQASVRGKTHHFTGDQDGRIETRTHCPHRHREADRVDHLRALAGREVDCREAVRFGRWAWSRWIEYRQKREAKRSSLA